MPWPNSSLNTFADQQFFLRHNDTAYWYQAQICACGSDPNAPSDMSQSNIACNVCGGLGRFYPNAPTLIRGIVSNAIQDRQLLDTGFELDGSDLVWSSDPWDAGPLSPFDLLILTGDPHTWPFEGQVLIRGTGTTDTLFYNASQLGDIYTVDPVAGASTSYTDAGATVSGKTIDWSNATSQPYAGTYYSLKYRAQYEWVVYMPPFTRFENTQSFGQKVVLRKRHIVRQSNLPTLIQP